MFRFTQATLTLILSSSLFLQGCSGGGSDSGGGSEAVTYNGNTAAAIISPENAEEIGIATTEGGTQAISEDAANESNPFALAFVSSGPSSDDINSTIAQIINSVHAQTNNLAIAVTVGAADFSADPYYCGGSITVPDNINATSGKLTFNNFCYDFLGPITMNGSIKFTKTATLLSISYTNFRVTFEGESFTINSSASCNLDTLGFVTTCSISSSYTGSDGLVYRIDNFSVNGDPTFGFDIDATFYHPTHGSVTVTTTSSIMLECTGTQPSSGSISYTGAGGTSGSVAFDSCTNYTYCYDLGGGPVCNTGTW